MGEMGRQGEQGEQGREGRWVDKECEIQSPSPSGRGI